MMDNYHCFKDVKPSIFCEFTAALGGSFVIVVLSGFISWNIVMYSLYLVLSAVYASLACIWYYVVVYDLTFIPLPLP